MLPSMRTNRKRERTSWSLRRRPSHEREYPPSAQTFLVSGRHKVRARSGTQGARERTVSQGRPGRYKPDHGTVCLRQPETRKDVRSASPVPPPPGQDSLSGSSVPEPSAEGRGCTVSCPLQRADLVEAVPRGGVGCGKAWPPAEKQSRSRLAAVPPGSCARKRRTRSLQKRAFTENARVIHAVG